MVIVNYCQWGNTGQLIRQLRSAPCAQAGKVEVVVVDNHSPSHPLIRWLRRCPGVSLRRWRKNQGFARAVNEGCRLSRGEWYLLLNPDVRLPDHFLEGVFAARDRLANEDPRTGVIGFQLRHGDGSRQFSCGAFPTLVGTVSGLALPRARRKYLPLRGRRRCRVPWVTGCCMLLRRECLRQLGGFDESFFLYYEDVDLCRRARANGWSVWYEPELRVVHQRPLHTRQVSLPLRWMTRHALLTYAAKHWPRWQVQVLAAMVRVEAWCRSRWARWRGDARRADRYAGLGALAADLARGNHRAARRKLIKTIRSLQGSASWSRPNRPGKSPASPS